MEAFDFLPSKLDGSIKVLIYSLLGIHLIAFIIWVSLFTKSLLNKPKNF